MFAPTYFPPTYFPPTYFGTGGGTPPVTYATLLEAVVATLKGALVPGTVTGVYSDRVPPRTQAPYVVIYSAIESPDYMTDASGVDYIDSGSFQASVFAEGRVAARDIGRQVESALNDAPLTFDDGTLMVLRREWRNVEMDPDRDPAGKPLWACQVQFAYECQRTL